jgi:hypothetical protein
VVILYHIFKPFSKLFNSKKENQKIGVLVIKKLLFVLALSFFVYNKPQLEGMENRLKLSDTKKLTHQNLTLASKKRKQPTTPTSLQLDDEEQGDEKKEVQVIIRTGKLGRTEEEDLLLILSFLGSGELICQISLVCKKFNEFASLAVTHLHLDFEGYVFQPCDNFKSIISKKKYPNLTKLSLLAAGFDFAEYNTDDYTVLEICKLCPTLKLLDLSGCKAIKVEWTRAIRNWYPNFQLINQEHIHRDGRRQIYFDYDHDHGIA